MSKHHPLAGLKTRLFGPYDTRHGLACPARDGWNTQSLDPKCTKSTHAKGKIPAKTMVFNKLSKGRLNLDSMNGEDGLMVQEQMGSRRIAVRCDGEEGRKKGWRRQINRMTAGRWGTAISDWANRKERSPPGQQLKPCQLQPSVVPGRVLRISLRC